MHRRAVSYLPAAIWLGILLLASGCGIPPDESSAIAMPTLVPTEASIMRDPLHQLAPTPDPRNSSYERLLVLLTGNPNPTPKQRAEHAYIRKLQDKLARLVIASMNGADVEKVASDNLIMMTSDRKVLVEILVNGNVGEATRQLIELGMEVTGSSDRFRIVSGYLPLELILPAARLQVVRAIIAPYATTDPVTE
jgi:hypothetical protein